MEQELSNAAVAVVGVTAVGSLGTWAIIGQRLRQHGEVIPNEPRLSVPWTGWQVLFVFLACNFLPALAYPINGLKLGAPFAEMVPDKVATLMATMGAMSLIVLFLGLLLIKILAQANLQDFGLSLRHSLRDFLVGSFGFMAATLPVLGIQFVVSQIVEYDHPVLDMLNGKTTERLWLVAMLSAVVVAPLMEEFLFRVLLQGWLEKVAEPPPRVVVPSGGTESILGSAAAETAAENSRELDEENPYAAPKSHPSDTRRSIREPVQARAVWPIWASAAIFALMHFGQGAAPIPLLLLGAILGYVYRQTHRLVPCVVLHALFNLFSLLIYRLSVQS